MRTVLAVVLSLGAIVAVATHELAPGVVESIRSRVGWSRAPALAAAPASPAIEANTDVETDSDDVDPAQPAKLRPPRIIASGDHRARTRAAGRHPER